MRSSGVVSVVFYACISYTFNFVQLRSTRAVGFIS